MVGDSGEKLAQQLVSCLLFPPAPLSALLLLGPMFYKRDRTLLLGKKMFSSGKRHCFGLVLFFSIT